MRSPKEVKQAIDAELRLDQNPQTGRPNAADDAAGLDGVPAGAERLNEQLGPRPLELEQLLGGELKFRCRPLADLDRSRRQWVPPRQLDSSRCS